MGSQRVRHDLTTKQTTKQQQLQRDLRQIFNIPFLQLFTYKVSETFNYWVTPRTSGFLGIRKRAAHVGRLDS